MCRSADTDTDLGTGIHTDTDTAKSRAIDFGIGTDGGSFGFVVSENNWLGGGKKINFELDVDQESIGGTFNYSDPNYNFLGNSITYSILSERNHKPDLGFENSLLAAAIGTSIEQ